MFFKAASLDEVVACLKDGADPNDNKPGYLAGTPLHHGVRRNSLAMVRTLLDAGADVHRRDSGGSTPLHTAASSSDSPAMLDALLLGGADVGAPDKDWNTPLHELARFNSLDQHSVALAGVLLDAGADVNARQYHGYTPLHFAARKKSLAIVEMLLDAGAEVDARALLEAVPNFKEEHTSVLEALLAAGADPTAKDHGGRTALHYAAVSGNVTSCEVLIEAGADVTGRDNDGETPLHFAATLDEVEGIDCLLKAGADIEARDDQKNTPLHSSLDSDVHLVPAALPRGLYPVSVDLPAVDVLIHAGANLDARNAAGDTPLHLAAKYIAGSGGVPHGYDERTGSFASREVTGVRRYHAGDAIFALLEAGAEPTAKNRRGRTPCYFYRRNVFLRGQEIDLCE